MASCDVTFKGVDLWVEYDYQPEEKEVRYYSDGSGYPGCAESFDITKVSMRVGKEKVDVTELCETHFEAIEEAIRDSKSEY